MLRLTCVPLLLFAFAVAISAKPDRKPDRDEAEAAAAKKLEMAFGPHKGVQNAKFKFEVKQNSHVFACNAFAIQKDGWVKITPGYMAIFEDKPKKGERLGNIGEGPHLYVKFDRPVTTIGDMSNAKIKEILAKDGIKFQDFGK